MGLDHILPGDTLGSGGWRERLLTRREPPVAWVQSPGHLGKRDRPAHPHADRSFFYH